MTAPQLRALTALNAAGRGRWLAAEEVFEGGGGHSPRSIGIALSALSRQWPSLVEVENHGARHAKRYRITGHGVRVLELEVRA